ncbi:MULTISPECIES: M20 family metallopeptidase [unclassified Microbacterium]|uniref:M20 metallopeptidase family protein n=1 Tax=unclassified Microbacterium TaxID=2609290 RepID=UPI0012FCBD34|nr:M20 family metallopeptidase [Microbacterium sp. MAH-37]MVQ41015.1 amidohydrolase [Microbacterium sp. MAH-37]
MTLIDDATTTLVDDAEALLPDLQELRRDLHRNPEVGLDLPWTQQRVLQALEGLPLEITTGVKTSSITAVLRGGKPGRVVLLRGDMDGLPVREETDLDYASTTGRMHACGHDLHTAGLVGAARLLSARREEIEGSVVFMFQPGEEGCNGASVMIEEGILDAAGERPVGSYAIHVGPGPRGIVATKAGTLLAGSSTLHITVHGRGGHGSQPQSAADPVLPLSLIAAQLQSMITRRFDAFDPVVISVTQLSAGEAINVIPPSATLGATVRTMSQAALDALPGFITSLAEGIASAYGCTAEVDFTTQYIPTVNDEAETEFVIDELRELLGEEQVIVAPHGMMGSEDFSFVLAEVPGTFISLSSTPDDVELATAAMNHSPHVLFDDSVLGREAAILAGLAIARLRKAAAEG